MNKIWEAPTSALETLAVNVERWREAEQKRIEAERLAEKHRRIRGQIDRLAAFVKSEGTARPKGRITRAYETAWQRVPGLTDGITGTEVSFVRVDVATKSTVKIPHHYEVKAISVHMRKVDISTNIAGESYKPVEMGFADDGTPYMCEAVDINNPGIEPEDWRDIDLDQDAWHRVTRLMQDVGVPD